jgi:hypothetical protein
VSDQTVLAHDVSERLLVELVKDGRTAEDLAIPPTLVDELSAKAEAELGKRLQQRKEDLCRTNADIVTRRLASLQASYEATRSKYVELIGHARGRDRDPRYIRMLEGTLRNKTDDYELRRARIEEGRQVELTLNILGAGVARAMQC